MPSVRCQCDYEDFKMCVSKNKDQVYYCRKINGHDFTCAAIINGTEHIFEGYLPSTFFTDYPNAIKVRGISVL